jgi:hypothetical protein
MQMTLALEADAPAAGPRPRTRRRWLVAGLTVLVVALLGATVGWVVYVHSYQPLTDVGGPFELTGPATPTIKPVTDGISDTNWILVGPAGTRGTVNYTVSNTGHFAATILVLDRSQGGYITGLRWAPLNGPDGGGHGYEPGLLSESRPLPVTVEPRGEVLVQVTVTQPKCGGSNSGRDFGLGAVPIQWSAVGVHHTWFMPLAADSAARPIVLCPSKKALAHIDQF